MLPFTDAEVIAAFADWNVSTPAVGQGTFKVAFRARRNGSTDEVLKILLDPVDVDSEEFEVSDFSERLSRELIAMSETDCPYVVRITEPAQARFIGAQRFVWYAEPYYSGGTLEDRLKNGPLPLADVIKLLQALLTAIEAMWTSQKIVHRDIKPGNIVFDESGTPILLDLGIALYGNLSPLTDSMMSSPKTPRYSAPEQFEARKNAQIDFRTDHFLVGMVVYEALTGRHPFYTYGVSDADYFDRLERFSIASLDSVQAPIELKRVITRLMGAKPNRRYRIIGEPLRELERIS